MRVIDTAALLHGPLARDPFEWAALQGTLHADAARELSRTFPDAGFEAVRSDNPEKPYRMAVRNLTTAGGPPRIGDLSPVWRDLVADLYRPEYRRALSALFALPLQGLRMEIALWRYGAGCFLAPHTDKPEKVVSQLFYLTPSWNAAWGGSFLVLRDADVASAVERVAPSLGTSVVSRRSERSWHAVEEVRDAQAGERTSVQVVFYEDR